MTTKITEKSDSPPGRERDRGGMREPMSAKQAGPDPDFDDRMERLKAALDVTTETQLGRALGIMQESVAVARKRRQIPPRWLVEVFMRYGISCDWILSGEGSMKRGEGMHDGPVYPVACPSTEDFDLVPLLESRVIAGPAGEILYEEVSDYYPFKKWWIEKLVGKNPERKRNLLLVRVRGDSMSPTINQGDIALVDTYEGERIDIHIGKIYLVTQPDGATSVKRLALSERGGRISIICMSDNVAYNPFSFEIDQGRPLKYYVLGRVRWAGKEFD